MSALSGSQHNDILSVEPKDEADKTKVLAELKRRGNSAFKSGSYPEARVLYTRAIELDPTAALLSNRSMTLAAMGKFSDALMDANKCIATSPSWPKAHFRRGQALAGLTDFSGAHEAFKESLKLEPDNKTTAKEAAKALKNAEEKKLREQAEKDKPKENGSVVEKVIVDVNVKSKTMGRVGKDGKEKMRGYKVKEDGSVTTFFHRDIDESAKELIGSIAPKKIDQDEAMEVAKKSGAEGGSAWNAGGTFEEKEMSAWAKDRIVQLVKGAEVIVQTPGAESGLTLQVDAVEQMEGDATISFTRGKRRHIFDFQFNVGWSAHWEDKEGTEHSTKGKLFYHEFSGDVAADGDDYERELRWEKRCGVGAMEGSIKNHLLNINIGLSGEIQTKLSLFVIEFKAFT